MSSGDVTRSNDVVVRFNRIFDGSTKGTGIQSAIHYRNVERVAFYHNTIWGHDTSSDGGLLDEKAGGTPTPPNQLDSERVAFFNNVLGESASAGAHQVRILKPNLLHRFTDNVYFLTTSTDKRYKLDSNPDKNVFDYLTDMDNLNPKKEQRSVGGGAAPVQSGPSFVPVNNGDAHNQAEAIAEVDLVASANRIRVKWPESGTLGVGYFFHKGDSIRIGSPTGIVRTVNSKTSSVLTLNTNSGISVGDKVWINRSYNGTPDIGAIER